MKKIILFLLCVGFAFACSEHSHTDLKILIKPSIILNKG